MYVPFLLMFQTHLVTENAILCFNSKASDMFYFLDIHGRRYFSNMPTPPIPKVEAPHHCFARELPTIMSRHSKIDKHIFADGPGEAVIVALFFEPCAMQHGFGVIKNQNDEYVPFTLSEEVTTVEEFESKFYDLFVPI